MLNLIHTLASGSAIFLAFLVGTVRRDQNRLANRWLAVFLLMLGLFMLDDSLLIYGIYRRYPSMIGWFGLLVFGLAPALFLTVSRFVSIEKRFPRRGLWHFTPFFLFVLLSLPFLLIAPDDAKLKAVEEVTITTEDRVVLLFLTLHMLAYLFLSFRKLQKHRINIEVISATPTDVNLDWLLYFLLGVAAMVGVWFVELFVLPFNHNAGWVSFFYFIGIYALGYFALRQKEIFPFSNNETAEVVEILEEAETPPAARKQIFLPEKREQLKAQLLQKMETEKPYLDPELNLPGLARQMGLSLHELSELVNVGFGENFSQFVNRYRVEESKRLLLSDKYAHLSIVGIAFEAGFNSKTAFNIAFKKMTGISPSAFRAND